MHFILLQPISKSSMLTHCIKMNHCTSVYRLCSNVLIRLCLLEVLMPHFHMTQTSSHPPWVTKQTCKGCCDDESCDNVKRTSVNGREWNLGRNGTFCIRYYKKKSHTVPVTLISNIQHHSGYSDTFTFHSRESTGVIIALTVVLFHLIVHTSVPACAGCWIKMNSSIISVPN